MINSIKLFPKDYLSLEIEYCRKEQNLFDAAQGTALEWPARNLVTEKRAEFRKMWNITHAEKFPNYEVKTCCK